MFANLASQECSLKDSNENTIIEAAECESLQRKISIRLHHIIFQKNKLISSVGLKINTPSCSSLEMTRVEFVDNKCNNVCGAVLLLENSLNRVRIEGNEIRGEGDVIPTILTAAKGSKTRVTDMLASNNEETMSFVEAATLNVSDSLLLDDNATYDGNLPSSCVYLIGSNATI